MVHPVHVAAAATVGTGTGGGGGGGTWGARGGAARGRRRHLGGRSRH